ncbi:hypothetical protein Plhal703r1_c04g0024911 [Plasmopara halstedii]
MLKSSCNLFLFESGEILRWYRRALQHLKNERIHCEGFHDRVKRHKTDLGT